MPTNILTQNTLRPGLLVSFKSSLAGTLKYQKRTIEAPHELEDGSQKARWETERLIANPAEHMLGRKAQAAARACITKVCTNTAFGLLCPEADRQLLERGLVEARQVAKDFNDMATTGRLSIYVIAGYVASDDLEATKAISAEVRGLMERMEEGVKNCDVETIRSAANEANRLGTMLSADAAGRVKVAIDAARSAARRIVKAGEQAAQEVDQAAIARLSECRTSFLDLDGEQEAATPEAEGRAFDLTPEVPTPTEAGTTEGPQLELEDAIAEKTNAV